MTTSGRLLAAVLVLTMLGCGGGGGDDNAATTTTSTTASDPTTTAATGECAAGDADPAELEKLIVDDVAGFQKESDDVGDTGPSSLAKAISDDGEADAERALTDGRFRRGYQRLWSNEANDTIVLFLYEFCDGAGATAYGKRGSDLLAAASGMEVTPFAAEGVGSGVALSTDTIEAAFVVAPSGANLVEAISYAATGTDPAAVRQRAIDLASAQLARL